MNQRTLRLLLKTFGTITTWATAGVLTTMGFDWFAQWAAPYVANTLPTRGLLASIAITAFVWWALTGNPNLDAKATQSAARRLVPGTTGWLLGSLLGACLEVYGRTGQRSMTVAFSIFWLIMVLMYRDELRKQHR